jgi:hypothetical protein
MPGAMHSGFMQFAAFDQDAIDNQQFLAKGKLPMPVLAIGGEKSFGATMAKIMRFAASNVREGVIPASTVLARSAAVSDVMMTGGGGSSSSAMVAGGNVAVGSTIEQITHTSHSGDERARCSGFGA